VFLFRYHQPIIDWFQRRFDCTLNIVEHGRFDFPDHSELLMQKVRLFLHETTDWELSKGFDFSIYCIYTCIQFNLFDDHFIAAMYVLAENAKSFILSLALFEGVTDSRTALLASRTEEHFQIET
jgi:chaperone required for assembly of F1-ATPase